MVNYKEITCSVACNHLKSWLPYNWDLNIYRGCTHGCKYCYAIYSHSYLQNNSHFFDDIYVKTNIVDRLEKQLSSSKWPHEVINIGGVTDSYQSAEDVYKLMPDILKLLIKHKNPCIISTKSDLILRDIALLEELASITYVNIASTITCMDHQKQILIEPGCVSSERRFQMLGEFARTKASVGVHTMPILPYITDDTPNLEAIYYNSKQIGADYVLTSNLNLKGRTRIVFFEFVKQEFPKVYNKLWNLYQDNNLRAEYKKQLYLKLAPLKTKYGLSANYMKNMNKRLKPGEEYTQLTLF